MTMMTMKIRMTFLIKKIKMNNNLIDHRSTNSLLLSEDSPNNTTKMKTKIKKIKK